MFILESCMYTVHATTNLCNTSSESLYVYMYMCILTFIYPIPLFLPFQLVTEEFNRWQVRIQAWRMTGFAVVTIDNRGSANRGMQFEAHVKVKYIHVH